MPNLISPSPSPPPFPAPQHQRFQGAERRSQLYNYELLFHISDIPLCGVTRAQMPASWSKNGYAWWGPDSEDEDDVAARKQAKDAQDDATDVEMADPAPILGSPSFSRPVTLPPLQAPSPVPLLARPAPRGKGAENVILNAARHAQLKADDIHRYTPTFNTKNGFANDMREHLKFEPRVYKPDPRCATPEPYFLHWSPRSRALKEKDWEGERRERKRRDLMLRDPRGNIGTKKSDKELPWGESERNWLRFRGFERAWRKAKRNVRNGLVGDELVAVVGSKVVEVGREGQAKEQDPTESLEYLLTLALYADAVRRADGDLLPIIVGEEGMFGRRGEDEESSDEEGGLTDRLNPHAHSLLFYVLLDMYNDTEFGAINRARLVHWGLLEPADSPTVMLSEYQAATAANRAAKAATSRRQKTTATAPAINALGWSASLPPLRAPSKRVMVLSGPEGLAERAEEIAEGLKGGAKGNGKGKGKGGGKGKAVKGGKKDDGKITATKKGKGKAVVEPEPTLAKGKKGKAATANAAKAKARGRGKGVVEEEEDADDEEDVEMHGYEKRVWLSYVRAPVSAISYEDDDDDDEEEEEEMAALAKKNNKGKSKAQKPSTKAAMDEVQDSDDAGLTPPATPKSKKRALVAADEDEAVLRVKSTPVPESPKKRQKVAFTDAVQPEAGPSSSSTVSSIEEDDLPCRENLAKILSVLSPPASLALSPDLTALRSMDPGDAKRLLAQRKKDKKKLEEEFQEAYTVASTAVEELISAQSRLDGKRLWGL